MTRINSAQANVDARGAYFIGNGDLFIKAKEHILLGTDILDNKIIEKIRAFDWSVPGKSAWNSYHNGGSLWNMASAEDATLAKINALFHSNNSAELLANTSNLGIDLVNTTNNAMRGIAEGAVTNELMARYGLGCALTYTEAKNKTQFQTQAQGGIDRGGNVKLEADGGIELENGVRVHAGGNLEIDTPELIAHAAALQSGFDEMKCSQSIGMNLIGQMQSIGATYAKTHNSSIHYVNAEISAERVSRWSNPNTNGLFAAKQYYEQGQYWRSLIAAETGMLKMEGAMVIEGMHHISNVTKPLIHAAESFFNPSKIKRSPSAANVQSYQPHVSHQAI